jgi:glycosyltransferase involved in cell wall biosynthesis
MRRYGDMVVAAVAAVTAPGDIDLRRLELAPSAGLVALFPRRLEPWGLRAWARLRTLAGPVYPADVVHVLDASSGMTAGLRLGGPMVATVHDLIPLLQLRGRLAGGARPSLLARRVIGRTTLDLARAKRVVADSRRTAEDVIELARVDPARVTTIPLPVAPVFLDGLSTRPPLEPRLILHVGSGGFYKNSMGVLRIFGRVQQRISVRLKLVGASPTEEMKHLIGQLGLEGRIDVYPSATDAELASFYRQASLLLMPSLYEGFGWPALEAMACGCPVVCSTAGSLSDVVGDAALTASAGDEDRLAEHAIAILSNSDLAQRLSDRGRARARGFGLEEMGRRLVEVYHAAVECDREEPS